MKAKEQKIKDAYGDCWENFNDSAKQCALKHDGFISSILEHRLTDIETEYSDSKTAWRPKSLSGIENNNGWIRIESEADYENLSFKCLVFTDKENEYTYTQYCNSFTISETEKITHYRLIEKHAKPIY